MAIPLWEITLVGLNIDKWDLTTKVFENVHSPFCSFLSIVAASGRYANFIN